MTSELSRRRFLQAGSAASAAAILAACSSTNTTAPNASTTIAGGSAGTGSVGSPPGSTITSGTVPGIDAAKLADIDHVVIFMKENRSFVHYFGVRPGVVGFADTNVRKLPNGKPVWYQPSASHPDGYILPFRYDTAATKAQCALDPDHSWGAQHAAWNGGKVDGFADAMGPASLGYFTRADLPYYWALADAYTLCDRTFCSVLGPTEPNRLYFMTGTVDAEGKAGGPASGNSHGPYSWETYPERLEKAGVSWRVYHTEDDDDGDNVLRFFKQYQDLAPGNPLHDNAIVDRPASAFLDDARNGNLPQVSWIVAPASLSEHPIWPPAYGEDLTSQTLDALMSNEKAWAKTMFILTYDENGGFFDHVPPPSPEPGTKGEFIDGQPIGLGFRVPMMIVSPWSRGGKVNSDVYDHTSILKFLERRFGVEVPNLSTWRRQLVGDLTSTLDLSAPDPRKPTLPATAARVDLAKTQCGTLPLPDVPSPQVEPSVDTA
jgi:phospholipase C